MPRYLREEKVREKKRRNKVEFARLAVPRDRVRELLVFYDAAVRDELYNDWLKLSSHDLWVFILELFPELGPDCTGCEIDFPTWFTAEIIIYKNKE